MFQKIINKLNDLRPRQLLILAFGAAALMFVILYVSMNLLVKKEEVVIEKTKYSTESTSVVVAKMNIPPRTRIQDNMLQLKEVPVELVPEGAIKDFKDVKDVQVKVSIFAGDILTIQKVFSKTGDDGFVGAIPPDCRAISISVNDVTGVAGFARPGDFVDLLLSEKSPYSATTTILLQNVPLLSVNQDMTGGSSVASDATGSPSGAVANPTIATFALNPEDTLKLISATKLGEIYMSLRPTEPRNNYVPAMEYTLESVNMPPPEPEPAPAPQSNIPVIPDNSALVMPLPQLPAGAAPVPKIEIIQGDEVVQSAQEEITQASMPVIPSGAPAASSPVASRPSSSPSKVAKPLNSAPLSGSRVVQSFMQ